MAMRSSLETNPASASPKTKPGEIPLGYVIVLKIEDYVTGHETVWLTDRALMIARLLRIDEYTLKEYTIRALQNKAEDWPVIVARYGLAQLDIALTKADQLTKVGPYLFEGHKPCKNMWVVRRINAKL